MNTGRPFTSLVTAAIVFGILSLSAAFILFLESSRTGLDVQEGLQWKVKSSEVKSYTTAVPILLYHNIGGKGAYSIDEERFREQLLFLLGKGIDIIPLEALTERLDRPEPLPSRSIAISFDDGYFSMYEKLLPICREYRIPATLFVYAGAICSRGKSCLSWRHLREMEQGGISIECHSISHRDLVRLEALKTDSSRRQLFEEIYVAKRVLELRLGKRIRYYAFPYGRYNLALIELCRYAGYERVFSTDYGTNLITRNNYCLRRHHVKSDYGTEMIQKIADEL